MRGGGGLADSGQIGFAIAKTDVIGNGFRKEECFLGRHRDSRPQFLDWIIVDISAIDQQLAGCGSVQPCNEGQQRALS